jgi:inner membrane protein
LPSPIAHTTAGYVVYRLFHKRIQTDRFKQPKRPFRLLLIFTIFLSLLPDFDFLIGVITGNLAKFHNNGTHSLIFGFLISLFVSGATWLKTRSDFLKWFLVGVLSYNLHIVMDFFTYDTRGVMLFWPLTAERFASPIKLFYGVHWSDGWISTRHLWTLATELLFALFVIGLSQVIGRDQPSSVKV